MRDDDIYVEFKKNFVLFENTGVQFVDFKLDLSDEEAFERCERLPYMLGSLQSEDENQNVKDVNVSAICVKHKTEKGETSYFNTLTQEEFQSSSNLKTVAVEDVLAAYEGKWFPLPFFKKLDGNNAYSESPLFWCRGFFKAETPEERAQRIYHLVLAFDTQSSDEIGQNFVVSKEDVQSKAHFELCRNGRTISIYTLRDEINNWAANIWKEYATNVLEFTPEKIKNLAADVQHLGYYSALVNILTNQDFVKIPGVEVGSFSADKIGERAVRVDLVLDVGNSRTCALMIENNGNSNGTAALLRSKYQLRLRDLCDPTIIYRDAFPSRVEFALPSFKCHERSVAQYMCGGEPPAGDFFAWPSLVRTGFEAERLSWELSGNEGLTGLSSPKRYLWDDAPQKTYWNINPSLIVGRENEPANVGTICNFITGSGQALFMDPANSEPVFNPEYTRQSMMTFLINEILAQAFCQMNSPWQRSMMENMDAPRYFGSIILTVPPGMVRQEIDIYRECVYQAVGIFWKGMGWDQSDAAEDPFTQEPGSIWPPLGDPKRSSAENEREPGSSMICIKWDEALCGQMVYLYNEAVFNYGSDYLRFFRSVSKDGGDGLTIATVDIGGGTTDLVVNRFSVPKEVGGRSDDNSRNSFMVADQYFRESFKNAGDDILLDLITRCVLPSIKDFMKKRGLADDVVQTVLNRRLGTGSSTVQERTLRRNLTLQFFEPLAIRILSILEQGEGITDPFGENVDHGMSGRTFREILEYGALEKAPHQMKAEVENFINNDFKELLHDDSFSILDIPLRVDFVKLQNLLARCSSFDICEKAFAYAAEVIAAYKCDIVLLTGRPSRLPGVLACFRNCTWMAPDRVIAMSSYKISSWYPFAENGHIVDPKTTAVVGAMLCYICSLTTMNNFSFKSGAIRIKSCIRYIGCLDARREHLSDQNIYYRDVDFDDPKYKLEGDFLLSNTMIIGYRQMNIDRWPAVPLYELSISESKAQIISGKRDAVLSISLERDGEFTEDYKKAKRGYGYISPAALKISKVKLQSGDGDEDFSEEDVKLRFCTLQNGTGGFGYWLESGSVINEE